MENSQGFVMISSLISIGGIFYIFAWRYRILVMEAFRQSLFELRDRVFDFAASGAISFDHPAYVMLRTTINGGIRVGHRETAWHAVVLMALLNSEDTELIFARHDEKWKQATKDLTPDVQAEIKKIRERIRFLAGFYCQLASPLSVVLLIPAVLIIMVRNSHIRSELMKDLRKETSGPRKETVDLQSSDPLQLKRLFEEVALIYGENSSKPAIAGTATAPV